MTPPPRVRSPSVGVTVGLSVLVVLIACAETLDASRPVAAGLLWWLGLLALGLLARLRHGSSALPARRR